MHKIEPYYRWLPLYDPAIDERSPFYGKEYNYDLYSETIYGYYIDPAWDAIGSDTLYIKLLNVDYEHGYCIIELIGEWNDAINNDIMTLKRNIIDHLLDYGISKYVIIGENVLNFHGSDDAYYEEWFEDVEDGWVVLIGFQEFVLQEMSLFNLDSYLNHGGELEISNWRTFKPSVLFNKLSTLIAYRLN